MSRARRMERPISTSPVVLHHEELLKLLADTGEWAAISGSETSAGVTSMQSTPQVERIMLADEGQRVVAEHRQTIEALEAEARAALADRFLGVRHAVERDEEGRGCCLRITLDFRLLDDPDAAYGEYREWIDRLSRMRAAIASDSIEFSLSPE